MTEDADDTERWFHDQVAASAPPTVQPPGAWASRLADAHSAEADIAEPLVAAGQLLRAYAAVHAAAARMRSALYGTLTAPGAPPGAAEALDAWDRLTGHAAVPEHHPDASPAVPSAGEIVEAARGGDRAAQDLVDVARDAAQERTRARARELRTRLSTQGAGDESAPDPDAG